MIPAIYLTNLVNIQNKLLNFMQLSIVVTYSSVLLAITHVAACYYFIEILDFDVTGLGYAAMAYNGTCLIFLLITSSCI